MSYYQTKKFDFEWETKTIRNLKHSCIFPFMILKKISMDVVLKNQPSISDFQLGSNVVRPL